LPSAYPLFETAERLEDACALIYDALAERFRSDPSASELFRRLAGEERQHANRVRLLAARYRHDSKLFGSVDMAGKQLEALLEEALNVLEQIRSGAWVSDLESARAELVDLEDRFRAGHAEVIAALADPSLKKFFTSMAAQDESHRQLLLR
jgi:rubrerythrin